MATDPHDLKEGDEVSWKWGSGHPKGEVKDVVDDEASITTKRGKEVTRKGDEENPAVILKASSGSDAIKLASELDDVKPSK
ncbi:unnamed protein product [Tilletia controversa]|uniref:Hypervirulence associated protein TUDOR domain-containing protein n=3 Tax=Tilletia TaxID=13289 RepID=A0A8X7MQ42_9BASI|nr:hypothetical protein CF336_g2333 [Tilletia laevis]KAE8198042.1 hypothetical protein CF328_g3667 [Tilletia controversa]KAE8263104.1 hypothetical protein A4X03_0g1931 [Tilletia caries]KAE8206686.1 hypothetical protein CF335_g1686 [Tilletia laevis]KAE8244081.1 hypothetical protein A4X06_0g5980 [Tilletia controversa]